MGSGFIIALFILSFKLFARCLVPSAVVGNLHLEGRWRGLNGHFMEQVFTKTGGQKRGEIETGSYTDEELSCQCPWQQKVKRVSKWRRFSSDCYMVCPVCHSFRWVRPLSCLLLLPSNTSVTLSHQNVPHDMTWIYEYKTGTHTVSPRQQPEDKQLSLMRLPSMSEWKVKVNPWCLSVNWAYYVSASGCKEGRKEGR